MVVSILRQLIIIIYVGLTFFSCVAAILVNIIPLWSVLIMILGAIMLMIINYISFSKKLYIVAFSLLLIHIAAFINGFYTGGNSLFHHVIRLTISALIFTLFYYSEKYKSNEKENIK